MATPRVPDLTKVRTQVFFTLAPTQGLWLQYVAERHGKQLTEVIYRVFETMALAMPELISLKELTKHIFANEPFKSMSHEAMSDMMRALEIWRAIREGKEYNTDPPPVYTGRARKEGTFLTYKGGAAIAGPAYLVMDHLSQRFRLPYPHILRCATWLVMLRDDGLNLKSFRKFIQKAKEAQTPGRADEIEEDWTYFIDERRRYGPE